MDEFVYQAVADVGLCGNEARHVETRGPLCCLLWDPMCALA